MATMLFQDIVDKAIADRKAKKREANKKFAQKRKAKLKSELLIKFEPDADFKRREYQRNYQAQRYANDPEFRDKVREYQSNRWYNNPDAKAKKQAADRKRYYKKTYGDNWEAAMKRADSRRA